MPNKTPSTIPGFEFGLTGGVIALIITLIITALLFVFSPIGPILKETLGKLFFVIVFILTAHFICSGLMITASFLIKHEEHALGGSILILSVSTVALLLGVGLYIGPILGIISGIVGLKEHRKIMLTKKIY